MIIIVRLLLLILPDTVLKMNLQKGLNNQLFKVSFSTMLNKEKQQSYTQLYSFPCSCDKGKCQNI